MKLTPSCSPVPLKYAATQQQARKRQTGVKRTHKRSSKRLKFSVQSCNRTSSHDNSMSLSIYFSYFCFRLKYAYLWIRLVLRHIVSRWRDRQTAQGWSSRRRTDGNPRADEKWQERRNFSDLNTLDLKISLKLRNICIWFTGDIYFRSYSLLLDICHGGIWWVGAHYVHCAHYVGGWWTLGLIQPVASWNWGFQPAESNATHSV